MYSKYSDPPSSLFVLPTIIWFLKNPHVRYGANAYLSFMTLGIISLYFKYGFTYESKNQL